MTSQGIQGILHKLENVDPDLRHMAVYDLEKLLSNPDSDISGQENSISRALLVALGDNEQDVPGIATECLSKLSKRSTPEAVNAILDQLMKMSVDDTSNRQIRLQGLARQAIRAVLKSIDDMPRKADAVPNNLLLSTLDRLESLSKQKHMESTQSELMQILLQVLKVSGGQLFYDTGLALRVKSVLLDALENGSTSHRKSSINGIIELVTNLPTDEARKTLETLVDRAVDPSQIEKAMCYLQAVIELSSLANSLVDPYVPSTVEKLLDFLNSDDDILRSVCLNAIEAFVRFNTPKVLPTLPLITEKCTELAAYDPFYVYDDGKDMDVDEESDQESDDEYEDDEEDDYYEDDSSHKVRLGAVKVLEAVVSSVSNPLDQSIVELGPSLAKFFREHDDLIRTQVLKTYIVLLQRTGEAIKGEKIGRDVCEKAIVNWNSCAPITISAIKNTRKLNPKAVQTAQQTFAILSELVQLAPEPVDKEFETLSSWVSESFSFPNIVTIHYNAANTMTRDDLRLDTLDFVVAYLRNTRVSKSNANLLLGTWSNLLQLLSDIPVRIQKCLIETLGQFVDSFSSDVCSSLEPEISTQFVGTLDRTCDVVCGASGPDRNSVVRGSAINVIDTILMNSGTGLSQEKRQCLMDRASSSISDSTVRESALKSLSRVLTSPRIDTETFEQLATSAFTHASTLVKTVDGGVNIPALECIQSMKRLSPVKVGVSDKWISDYILPLLTSNNQLSISLSLSILVWCLPVASPSTLSSAISKSFSLIESDSGAAASDLPLLLNFSKAVATNFPDQVPDLQSQLIDIWKRLYSKSFSGIDQSQQQQQQQLSSKKINTSPFTDISQYISALASTDKSSIAHVIDSSIEIISDEQSPEVDVLLYIQVSSYAVRESPESLHQVANAVIERLRDDSALVRQVAASSLGQILVAYPSEVLQLLDGLMQSDNESFEYGLVAIKQGLKTLINLKADLSGLVESIWSILQKAISGEGKSLQSTLSKCAALVLQASPEVYVERLRLQLTNGPKGAIFVLSVTAKVMSGKYSVGVEDGMLRPLIAEIIPLVEDSDLYISTQALYVFNLLSGMRTELLRSVSGKLIPSVHRVTVIKEELTRVLQLGTEKYKVDDGLEARKLAYNIWNNIALNCSASIDSETLFEPIIRGLNDDADIQAICQDMVIGLGSKFRNEIVKHIDGVSQSLLNTINAKLRKNPVLSEIERKKKNTRLAVQTAVSIGKLPGVGNAQTYNSLIAAIRSEGGWATECYNEFSAK